MILHHDDNVAVALEELLSGDVVLAGERRILLKSDIPFGHKFSLEFIPEGAQILKYGLPIGVSICDIEQGEWVHLHNLRSDYKPILESK